ncbi:hypothetical protein GDO86_011316 [Hymenochirus boettgeri]|uniref:Apoptosis regulator Bcl-2 n=1 Tax=Hymenochirus boettgeri TaxID=247094 RepID=A0A8T2JG42_9PIPI|nr:hypothetical protein GDO86_011316 [Hymenochirus boettgeri]KAG8442475.1 hypothetical protein GDO86_011316 [Hymenochirus boettgeri]
MANPRRGGYDHRDIVVKYIHYKLSQKGYEWEEGRHQAPAELPQASAAINNDSGDGEMPTASADPRGQPQASPAASLDQENHSPNPISSTDRNPASVRRSASAASPTADLNVVQRNGNQTADNGGEEEVLLQPVPQAVLPTLGRAGDEFSRLYQQDFRQISGLLHLTPSTVRLRFAAVVEELFHDGVNWGRIVAFFEFGGVMCVESINREMSPLVDSIVGWMTEYLNRHLQNWIQEQGGWDTFVELYGNNVRPPFDPSWLSVKTILSLAVVGACITLGAYFGHK